MRCCGRVLAILTVCCSSAAAATLHVDTFDVDVQGWSGGGVPEHVPTGGAGDGGGFLRVPTGTNLATFNTDPRWIGDLTAIGADRIRVDLMAPTTSEPLPIRVVLFGPSNNQQRWTSTVAQTVPNDGVWRNYTFSLDAADLVATQQHVPLITYAQMMASTIIVMLRYDPDGPSHGGAFVNGELDVDNVELASAPLVGDFDGDGDVDGVDLSHPTLGWRTRFSADLDGDDFLDWQRNLSPPAGTRAVGAVPEPATAALLAAPAAIGLWRRGRRRRLQARDVRVAGSTAPIAPRRPRRREPS